MRDFYKEDMSEIKFTKRFDPVKWKAAMPKDVPRRKVSEKLGIVDMTLYQIEKGKNRPSMELAIKYCELVGIGLDDLITDDAEDK